MALSKVDKLGAKITTRMCSSAFLVFIQHLPLPTGAEKVFYYSLLLQSSAFDHNATNYSRSGEVEVGSKCHHMPAQSAPENVHLFINSNE